MGVVLVKVVVVEELMVVVAGMVDVMLLEVVAPDV